ncbi:MAG TPA: integrase [Thiobacillus sp.]
MPKTLEFIADHLPRVTVDEVRRFSDTVEIRDAQAFAAELEAFVQERIESVELPPALEIPIEVETVDQTLARKAAALRADTRWAPRETEIQRGRAAMLEAFEQPHNLPLPDFARLANKSRQQIYKDIEARRLLALNVGPRGRRLPDWQLDPVKQRLTQIVLQAAPEVDAWTLYRALSEPLEGLAGRSPVEAVTADSVDDVAKAVFNVLGVH